MRSFFNSVGSETPSGTAITEGGRCLLVRLRTVEILEPILCYQRPAIAFSFWELSKTKLTQKPISSDTTSVDDVNRSLKHAVWVWRMRCAQTLFLSGPTEHLNSLLYNSLMIFFTRREACAIPTMVLFFSLQSAWVLFSKTNQCLVMLQESIKHEENMLQPPLEDTNFGRFPLSRF